MLAEPGVEAAHARGRGHGNACATLAPALAAALAAAAGAGAVGPLPRIAHLAAAAKAQQAAWDIADH